MSNFEVIKKASIGELIDRLESIAEQHGRHLQITMPDGRDVMPEDERNIDFRFVTAPNGDEHLYICGISDSEVA